MISFYHFLLEDETRAFLNLKIQALTIVYYETARRGMRTCDDKTKVGSILSIQLNDCRTTKLFYTNKQHPVNMHIHDIVLSPAITVTYTTNIYMAKFSKNIHVVTSPAFSLSTRFISNKLFSRCYAHRCPRQQRQRQQRQRVTEGTAMAPWNGPNKPAQCSVGYAERSFCICQSHEFSCFCIRTPACGIGLRSL